MGYRSGGLRVPPRAAAVFAVGIVLVVVGFLALREPRGGEQAASAAGTTALLRPTVPEEVVQVVATWMDRTSSPEDVVTARRRDALVHDLVARSARSRVSEQLSQTAAAFTTDDAAGFVVQAVPIGYRIRSIDRTRATVDAAQAMLQAAPGTMTTGALATSRIALVREDRWRIAKATVSAQPLNGVSRAELVRAHDLTGFHHVP